MRAQGRLRLFSTEMAGSELEEHSGHRVPRYEGGKGMLCYGIVSEGGGEKSGVREREREM